ncbi:hypothetical protein J7K06_07555 [Candidatus Bathyarchaeota archaeon]|nr:hypothetical protein [Candidatus Bathyarchaeota archaeon]
MGILDRLFKKKKAEEKIIKENEKSVGPTELEKLCKGNLEVYNALKDVMFLDPRKINVSIKDAVANAEKFKKEKDNLRAAMWYRMAGGLAIYNGKVSEVKKYFAEYAKLTGREPKILKVLNEAVKVAREYYKKYLK